jgi:hypothetical protein
VAVSGLRFFDGIDKRKVPLDIIQSIPPPSVTHLRYAVKKL